MKQKMTKGKIKCAIIIIGVIIIPLFYSYFYLGAFWDPYASLDALPVAVVNNDQGTVIHEVERNIGEELCERLEADATLKFVFVDEKKAKEGTEGHHYYAMIVIPDKFSDNIASATSSEKQTAVITYAPNEKSNYLTSQILSRAVLEIEESTRASIDKEIVQGLSDKLQLVPDKMTELQEGMNELYDGSAKLMEGTDTLAEGTATFYDKFADYEGGVSDVKKGTDTLNKGIVTLDSGINKLLSGANKVTSSTADITKLSAGAKSLASGANAFNQSLIQYTAGVDTLISSVNSTSVFLANYVTKVNPSIMKEPVFASFINKLSNPTNAQNIQALQDANSKLKVASQQITEGSSELAKGTKNLPKLKKALKQLSNGLKKASEGSSELKTGSSSLYSGISTLGDATTQLSKAAGDISDGADSLRDGTGKLKDGLETAKVGIDTSITDTDEELVALEGLPDFAAKPVSVQQENITTIPNYGTAFAPYFLSLSLWVGAIMIFFGIFLDSDSKFQILSRYSEHKLARTFIYLLIGLVQAVVLGSVLLFGLGLKVDSLALYFASCCLVSLVFISIVQFLMVHLKDLGKFLSILLLILQLTSCGGTFPMETLPKIFNVLYPYMPMTYSVGLLKQAISGINTKDVIYNGGILCAILIVSTSMTILVSVQKLKKTRKTNVLLEEN